jgi:hypothetical protein
LLLALLNNLLSLGAWVFAIVIWLFVLLLPSV